MPSSSDGLRSVRSTLLRAPWGWAPDAIIHTASGVWLATDDVSLRDRAVEEVGDHYVLFSIDCWNSMAERATVARIRIDTHRDGKTATAWADRRYPDLARAGVLADVAADWLAQKVRAAAKPPASPTTRKADDQRERAVRLVRTLASRGAVELAPESTVEDLGDRTRRVLFVLSRTRADAIAGLERMFLDSSHVAELLGTSSDISAALDEIRYRR